MSDYSRIYNLTVKDTLPSGNSGKVIKGAELDAEYNAIAAAISSKADTNSPVFTGTPLASTAASGTNTTQLATTAFVQAALQALYPVGSVYINATVDTNPATLLGFGTWVTVGDGRVLVNQNTSDTSFDTLGETGGSKSSIAAHTHAVTGTTLSSGSHTHSISDPGHVHQQNLPSTSGSNDEASVGTTYSGSVGSYLNTGSKTTGITINSVGSHTHDLSFLSGSTGTADGNLQPYVVVKMWKRTA